MLRAGQTRLRRRGGGAYIIRAMRLDDFHYDLPPELIAQAPAETRSASRLLHLDGATVNRREVWPDADHEGMVVLLAGGEAGVLARWQHAEDRQWWRWTLELSNHRDRPADWRPPGS